MLDEKEIKRRNQIALMEFEKYMGYMTIEELAYFKECILNFDYPHFADDRVKEMKENYARDN